MMGSQGLSTTTEGSALVSCGQNFQAATTGPVNADSGVTAVASQDIQKKPIGSYMASLLIENQTDHDLSKSHGFMVSGDENPSLEITNFNKEQMDILKKILGQTQSTPAIALINTSSIAQKGNFLNTLSDKSEKSNPWIIDFGVSNHMSGDATLFLLTTSVPIIIMFKLQMGLYP